MQRKFDVVRHGVGGSIFPNPETSFSSSWPMSRTTTTSLGSRTSASTSCSTIYDVEFDQQKRVDIIREIDGILANDHHYILKWEAPFSRIAYWNKFGHPHGYLTRIDDLGDCSGCGGSTPQKSRQLDRALTRSITEACGHRWKMRYWQEYTKTQGAATRAN